MAMDDTVATETKMQDELLGLIVEHKKRMASEGRSARYRTDAIRELVTFGWQQKGRDLDVKPRFVSKFDKAEGRIGFSVTKAIKVVVENYANKHDIEFQQAYFEFICCGLEFKNGQKPL